MELKPNDNYMKDKDENSSLEEILPI